MDVERRLPVWQALSNLFLDTELMPEDYRQLAATLRRSGYARAELRTILLEEVAPAFMFNLFDVAGEWTPWSEEEVRVIMLRSLRPGRVAAALEWLRKRASRRVAADEWARLEPLLGERP